MGKIIGIDLGTSNSAAASLVGGKPTIIPAAEGTTVGGKAFPSVVAFTKDGQLLVGEPARRQMVSNAEGTIIAAKRKMGTDFKFNAYGKEYTPQQISAFILQKIKKDAEAFLGETVDKAVITVPAYFNDNQRQATKDAGMIAGLEVVRIINEPTAASLAYGLDKAEKDLKIMVFDFGGGTLDVTIMELGGGVFEVKSTSGDTQLGGTDMDNVLIDYVVNKFKEESGIDLNNDRTAMTRIREAAEKAKIELSSTITTEINLPFIAYDKSTNAPKNLAMQLTRSKLDELVRPIVDRCRSSMTQTLEDAKLKPDQVDKIILIGGPTRMPIVHQFVAGVMGKEPERGVDPMEAVAIGAAIQGAIIAGDISRDIVLLDVTPLTLGVEVLGGLREPLIERNTTIPVKKSKIFTTAADYQTAVTIHIAQGERPMAADNVSLGMFNLDGIPPAPRGVPQVEVTFDIDSNGILHVSAKDLATGKEQKITITATTKLSKEEIEKLKKDSDQFAEQDRKKKEEAETRNEADNLIYAAEKLVKQDLKDKITSEQTERINKAVAALKEALNGSDVSNLKSKIQELKNVLGEVSTQVYQAAGKAASPGPSSGPNAGQWQQGADQGNQGQQ
ncbi:MAG: molecular chaperone DnaK [Thaumarchaeota archaeon]|nr:molecular chaperone DnaK [Nitrososphaerota archaeon]